MDGVYTLGILGGGRAAWAFGSTWLRLGWSIDGVWLRPESQSRLPELLGVPRKNIEEINADLLFIAVSDRAIGDVVGQIRAKGEGGRAKGQHNAPSVSILFHASGATPAPPGGFSLHPLKSLPPVGAPSDLAGSLLVFEGAHRDVAEQIAEASGARFAAIATDDKVRYHAGAVFGANYVAALLDVAEELIGIDGARDDLANLAVSAIENWRAQTDGRRFTGPAARGDLEVINKHLAALADRPELAEIYRLLAARILATRK
jgi:predicted short-subunit dehydrogenase-like oxidoreductase (DUF2520 family)